MFLQYNSYEEQTVTQMRQQQQNNSDIR